ncbi:MAG: outer membrane lipoprotein chaperone LolA [Gammaproteobacteria bacterium]
MNHTRRFSIALAMTVLAMPFGLPGLAQDRVDQDRAEERLDALLLDIESLGAEVLQLIVESDGGVLEESEIQMYLKKPGRFYWETLDPFPELVVTDGDTLWNYQPDLEQVVIEDWNSSESELAAQLLSGQTDQLKQEYRITLADAEDIEFDEFQLQPLAADSVYAGIRISFQQGELDSIHLSNKNGQQTVWRFSEVQRNLELEESLFKFVPPVGIEVVDNSSPP